MDDLRDNALSSRKVFTVEVTGAPGETKAAEVQLPETVGSTAGRHWKKYLTYQKTAKQSASRLFYVRSFCGTLLAFFSRNALNPVYNFYVPLFLQDDLGVEAWVAFSVVGALDNFLGLLFATLIGSASDCRLVPVQGFPRRKPWVFVGVVLAAAGLVLVPVTKVTELALLACFIHVLGRQLRGPPMYAVLGDQFSPRSRPMMHAYNTAMSATGMATAFIIAGATSAIGAAYLVIFLMTSIPVVVSVTLYCLILKERTPPLKKYFVLELARSSNLILVCMRSKGDAGVVRLVVRREGMAKGDVASDVLLATSTSNRYEGIRFNLTRNARQAGWSLGGGSFSPTEMTLGVESSEMKEKFEAGQEHYDDDETGSENEGVHVAEGSTPRRDISYEDCQASVRGWSALASILFAGTGSSLFEVSLSSFAVKTLNLNKAVAAACVMLFGVSYILCIIPLAIVSRYAGPMKVLACGLVGLAVLCFVGYALIVDIYTFIVFLVMAGFFTAMTVVNYLPLILEAGRKGNFGIFAGMYATTLSLAGIIGPVAGGISVSFFDYRVIFLYTGGTLLLAFVVLLPNFFLTTYWCMHKRVEVRRNDCAARPVEAT